MRRHAFDGILRACAIAAAFLLIDASQSKAFAQGGPTRVSGGGEATAAAFVQYVRHVGGIQNVPSIGTVGNRITFGFNAHRDDDGEVRGQMQLVDHTLGIVIHSDVILLNVPHPVLNRPVGSTGVSARMLSSTDSVTVDGEPRPGWNFRNTPLFDGGEGRKGTGDTVCFELFNAEGVVVLQWSAFLSSGNVQIKD